MQTKILNTITSDGYDEVSCTQCLFIGKPLRYNFIYILYLFGTI